MNFTFDIEKPGRGKIYLDGEHFANYYTLPGDWGKSAGKVCFNRDAGAFKHNCPIIGPKDSIEEILKELVDIFTEKSRVNP